MSASTLRVLTLLMLAAVTGCADAHYQRMDAGILKGRVIVEWYKPNLFVYRPDPQAPLVFTRKRGGAPIQPRLMYTDGGSIPRPFWALRNYSPWGFGPAFIVHDWLFHMRHCQLEGYRDHSLHDAAIIMSEVMKTLMETPGFEYGSESSVYLMYEAVQTAPAKESWEHGECINPAEERGLPDKPDATFVVGVG